MHQSIKTDSPTRIQSAPLPILSSRSSTLPANRVLSVELHNDETVEWSWTFNADGTGYVSGYTIIRREP